MTAQDVLDCFNDSFLSVFFPKFDSVEGQEYLLALSQYALDCGNGKTIAENCPAIFCCWASNYIAWLLSNWADAEVSEDGTIGIADPAISQPSFYLKKKTIGGKTCEWDVLDVSKSCSTCPTKAVDEWEAKWKELAECCEATLCEPFIAGGTYRHKSSCNSCCGADGWLY